MYLEESKQILRKAPLFRELTEPHLDLILTICEETFYNAGQFVFRQDDPGDALYLIADGEVEILLESMGGGAKPILLATLKTSEVFGEIVLLEAGRRTASARSRTDTHLLRMPRRRLAGLLADYPEIGFRIMRRMAVDLVSKLRSANRSLRENIVWQPLDNLNLKESDA